ncbi:ATP-dependent endonuclease [Bacillus anthracis]|nr:ATP-dependent endonuclease [Bacillus anthracis]PEZ79989.1 ATP-dependent endonuclease [Bacillus anthracis]
MKLTKVKIYNFRSFHEEETIDLENFTAIIGSNSSGKTSFFQALLKLFGETSREREILRSDFHVPSHMDPNDLTENQYFIDVTIEFPEVLGEDSIAKSTVPPFFGNFVIEEGGRAPYIRIRQEATWQKSNQPEGIIESSMFFVTTGHGDEILDVHKKTISKAYLSLIKMIYIPALRNPNDQLKMVSGTLLWRLINRINFEDQFKEDISTQIGTIHEIIDKQKGLSKLKDIIRTEWKNYHNESRYVNVDLNFNTNNIEDILKKIDANFSPTEVGKNYTVDALGDGLRSLFYFSLVGSLLKTEEVTLKEISDNPLIDINDRTFSNTPPLLTLVAVEEPENHVAPHLLGKIVSNLRGISEGGNSQVILSSHSASIIKRVDPVEIRHFRNSKGDLGTVINKILLPAKEADEYKYVKEAVKSYPEIYFSSLVILGEGDSEEIIIPRILEDCDLDIHTHEISIVPLGGRHVNHFWKLLTQLNIPYITLLDLDIERHGGGWGRIKYVIDQLILNGVSKEEIFNLNEDQPIDESILEEMFNWDLEEENSNLDVLNEWVKLLESYNVFFSAPLDIDFLMIQAFKENYLKTLNSNEGPRIKIGEVQKKISDLEESEMQTKEYEERISHDVACTLKDKTKIGKQYEQAGKELMIWYNYFFLNRGKPTTHILALNNLDKEEFLGKLPTVFSEMIKAINKKLISGGRESE